MNIIQVSSGVLRIPVYKGGAVESYIMDLSRNLSRRGHKVTVLDRIYSKTDKRIEWMNGVRIVRLYAGRLDNLFRRLSTPSWYDLSGSFSIDRVVFALKVLGFLTNANTYDIVNVHFSDMAYVLAKKPNLRNKLVYVSHTPRRYADRTSILDYIALAVEDSVVSRIPKCIVSNELAKSRIVAETRIDPSRVTVIPTAIVDTDIFKPANPCNCNQTEKNVYTVLFVGRIRESKGVEYLVEAANILVNKWGYHSICFLVVGPARDFSSDACTDEYSAKIGKIITKYNLSNNVFLTGVLDAKTVNELFSKCQLFVLPSLKEASPLVVSEAMASGLPVIATNVGAVPLQVQDGVNGFLIRSADKMQIAEKVRFFLENPAWAKRMGANSRKIAVERLSWDGTIRAFIRSYEEILSFGRTPTIKMEAA